MPDPNLSSFIWSVADLLRGDYKQSDYGKVILPFTVLRRLDCVLEPTKAAVLAELAKRTQAKINPEPFLLRKSGHLVGRRSPARRLKDERLGSAISHGLGVRGPGKRRGVIDRAASRAICPGSVTRSDTGASRFIRRFSQQPPLGKQDVLTEGDLQQENVG